MALAAEYLISMGSEFGCICGDDYNEERILNSNFRKARPWVSLAAGNIK